jgi:hypothetical protein
MYTFEKAALAVLTVFPAFVFIQCGNGPEKTALSPEARQIVSRMEDPGDETSKEVFISLREQTVGKITADMLAGSEPIIVVESFFPRMSQYTSTIYTSQIQMSFTEEPERVKSFSTPTLTGNYFLVETDDVPDKTFEILAALTNDNMDEYLAAENRMPRFSNTAWFIAVIENDNGNIRVTNFKTR